MIIAIRQDVICSIFKTEEIYSNDIGVFSGEATIGIIENEEALANFFDLSCTPDSIDEYLDRYLEYRAAIKKVGWSEKRLKDPSEYGFTHAEYLQHAKKFTEVFKPICTHWREWVQEAKNKSVVMMLKEKFPKEVAGYNLDDPDVVREITVTLLDRLYRWSN